MKNMLKAMKNFWKDENGQSTTEYILILAAVVMVASKFKEPLKEIVGLVTGKVKTQIDTELQ